MFVSVSPEINHDENLCGSDFTLRWLLDSLVKNDDKFKEFQKDRVLKHLFARDVSGGKGMFSTVLKIELSFADEKDDEKVYTTILKIPGTESFAAITEEGKDVEEHKFGGNPLTQSIIQMHDTECNFYNLIAPLISNYVPNIYCTQRWIRNVHQGCLHMEDLSLRGKNIDFFNTLTVPQFQNVVNALAFFHSQILKLEESKWRGKFVSQRNIFTEMAPLIKQISPKFLQMITTGQKELTELYYNDKIQNILFNQEFIEYAFFDSYLKLGLPILLVHADLWASNIMFTTDSKGNLTDELTALLDWQCVHEGNWIFDFVRLMICSLDGDTRREMENTIFDFYISRLTEYLGKDPGFTAAQMKKSYQFVFLAHLGHSTAMSGGILGARHAGLAAEAKKSSTKPENGTDTAASSFKPKEDYAARGIPVELPAVEEARIDKCALRSIHVFEDALALLNSGEFDKWL